LNIDRFILLVLWAAHVARVREMRNALILSENLKGRYHAEDLGVDGKVLEWIIVKCGGKL
jgi:hypothetical protein